MYIFVYFRYSKWNEDFTRFKHADLFITHELQWKVSKSIAITIGTIKCIKCVLVIIAIINKILILQRFYENWFKHH